MFLGPVNSAQVHYSWEKSTSMAKKKRRRRRRENRDAKMQETQNPNRTLIYHGMIGAFESFRFYSQFIGFFFFKII